MPTMCAAVAIDTRAGPRLQGVIATMRDRDGFGFIQPISSGLGTRNNNNNNNSHIYFHSGDVFAGAADLMEQAEVRYTFVKPSRHGEKPKAAQVRACVAGALGGASGAHLLPAHCACEAF